ncbi:uncharacterized protein C8A04DRAFT_26148 [Dichotomopilus funicola]|uniref:Aminoglycoside phosphotransferase domain-containing protein n=1 Tax=Dichotomopilus funicola TaxID=1934379 RepID=A0AAN6ZPZ3_9PEZI|nr:hypothetical protein C8A04DRAFT_26148 [Dichotomopilus funicola]
MPLPVTLPLYNGLRIGLNDAQESEEDIIRRIAWYTAAAAATAELEEQSKEGIISNLASHHLGIRASRCIVEPTRNWPRGSFNQCVFIGIHARSIWGKIAETSSSRLLLRVPSAHRLVGMVEEKMRCEVATYIWMQENCPDVPIPRLYGFGFPDGRHFTHSSLLSWPRRWGRGLRRMFCYLFGYPVPSHYMERSRSHEFPAGYILLEFIEKGHPLAKSWFSKSVDAVKKQNLFRGISRLMLQLARIPLDRTGSFTFDPDTAVISLTNRPLTCSLAILENDGAEQVIEPNRTYESVDPYVEDLLTLHDNRFLAQPNAVTTKEDCYYQMAIHSTLRIMTHHYLDRSQRNGPFYMQFTDLHQGNMMVDDDWNITSLIDLEWICARSAQMIDVPYWITSKSIDEICSSHHSAEFAAAREVFMAAFREVEEELYPSRVVEDDENEDLEAGAVAPRRNAQGHPLLSETIDNSYASRATWFFQAVDSVNAMYRLFELQLRPQFLSQHTPETVDVFFAAFWNQQAKKIAKRKLQERKEYSAKLKELFQAKGAK